MSQIICTTKMGELYGNMVYVVYTNGANMFLHDLRCSAAKHNHKWYGTYQGKTPKYVFI